jgi:hypothetical protein
MIHLFNSVSVNFPFTQNLQWQILQLLVLWVPLIQFPAQNTVMQVLFNKYHRKTNLTGNLSSKSKQHLLKILKFDIRIVYFMQNPSKRD